MFDVLFIPYRDLYFWKTYGSAVRDLQFLEVLLDNENIDNITVVNRPVSIYERFLNKKKIDFKYSGIDLIDITSFDVLGPLKKREWTVYCYEKIVGEFVSRHSRVSNNQLIVLDFTPFAILPFVSCDKVIYWHDMIDNFTKHNCFSEKEKKLVDYKYKYVSSHYKFLTAVSDVAARAVIKYNKLHYDIIPNGVFRSKFFEDGLLVSEQLYDFGFVGFVTDKFDVDFVCFLAESYSVVVYGEVYNKRVSDKLAAHGVHIMGRFSYYDLPRLISSFKIGLLPYLKEKSHDGSPLKLYEYLKNNTPCITSINYEYSSKFVINYNESKDLDSDIKYLDGVSGNNAISDIIPDDAYLSVRLHKTIEALTSEGRRAD
ncbi:hypothetical protein ACOI2Q_14300 [Shewanella algae]|uniref:hypothetical protein n=1 Tax=Shewanella algae TaxID=38313 RepID=UPI003AAC9111